jgi:hypothetical protein
VTSSQRWGTGIFYGIQRIGVSEGGIIFGDGVFGVFRGFFSVSKTCFWAFFVLETFAMQPYSFRAAHTISYKLNWKFNILNVWEIACTQGILIASMNLIIFKKISSDVSTLLSEHAGKILHEN